MPGPISAKRIKESSVMCFSDASSVKGSATILVSNGKSESTVVSKAVEDFHSSILPGLPDDVSKYCLALVPRSDFSAMGAVSKQWRSFIKSKEFIIVRKLAGLLEEWLYVLTVDGDGKESRWEVLDCFGRKHHDLPTMPGPHKVGFGVASLNGKLLVVAGYSVLDGTASVSSDVYQYDSCLNCWSKLAGMNVARYDFACTEVNGNIYAVGGCGADGEALSSTEIYDADADKWTVIESLQRPRWGCFACGFGGKLYVMGGRSSFTIGNSRFVDVYDPASRAWARMKNGCVMVTAHAVAGKKLFCVEWKNERKLAIFSPADNSWERVAVPVTGSSTVGFRFGILDGKVLLLAAQEDPGYRTLVYDPEAGEWRSCGIKPSGLCVCSVTIRA
ncbi:F-box/kelch-repeat protein At1g67480 [Andrographis paniculata]|uniref:F-box/kelch-repeat protein At1g67480 n=1 Tax=Andrographis paniculata TaxID=175694 RepID=UPI0021E91052|nr:F-box/kelch-repeat protein At1g67480 [Andrographis paniculata]XP_051121452.1 F-box/kelch-repeat protein At1g67480 [Andrographis paniculata]XP_051121453.1 F-box/kelch-repeat protein At1g67480 [Andrographis paniculata]